MMFCSLRIILIKLQEDDYQGEETLEPALDTHTQKKPRKLIPGTNISEISKKYLDKESGVDSDKYHILEEGRILYSVVLNQTDIQSGSNSYYTMQLLAPDSGNGKFHVWFKWGRVGTKIGSTKLASFPNRLRAEKEFCDKFYQKSRNRWQDYVQDQFVKYGGAYFPLEIEYEEDVVESIPTEILPSSLDPRVQELVNLIYDTSTMQKAQK
jgi:predicted DNA-binding WGR domain protein